MWDVDLSSKISSRQGCGDDLIVISMWSCARLARTRYGKKDSILWFVWRRETSFGHKGNCISNHVPSSHVKIPRQLPWPPSVWAPVQNETDIIFSPHFSLSVRHSLILAGFWIPWIFCTSRYSELDSWFNFHGSCPAKAKWPKTLLT